MSVRRVFLWGPRCTEDTHKTRWLRHVWEVRDDGWEQFLGLLPMSEYYDSEEAAWASVEWCRSSIFRSSPGDSA